MTARIFSIQGKTRVIRIYERIGDEVLSLWERAERGVFCRARVRERARCLESFPHLAFGHPLPEGEDPLDKIHLQRNVDREQQELREELSK